MLARETSPNRDVASIIGHPRVESLVVACLASSVASTSLDDLCPRSYGLVRAGKKSTLWAAAHCISYRDMIMPLRTSIAASATGAPRRKAFLGPPLRVPQSAGFTAGSTGRRPKRDRLAIIIVVVAKVIYDARNDDRRRRDYRHNHQHAPRDRRDAGDDDRRHPRAPHRGPRRSFILYYIQYMTQHKCRRPMAPHRGPRRPCITDST
jgi:hypothetical protein